MRRTTTRSSIPFRWRRRVRRSEAEQPEEELAPAPGFNTEDAEAEFAVAQASVMAKQQAILESNQEEAYVEANWQFIRQKRAATGALFAELDAEAEVEAEADVEKPEEPELRLPHVPGAQNENSGHLRRQRVT